MLTPDQPEFAWCFSHGRLHYSRDWCTAFWVPLTGATEGEAVADKRERYGDATFMHHLPQDAQLEVMRSAHRDTP
jgi:hypothetical protein